jgi:hypothetical protein
MAINLVALSIRDPGRPGKRGPHDWAEAAVRWRTGAALDATPAADRDTRC